MGLNAFVSNLSIYRHGQSPCIKYFIDSMPPIEQESRLYLSITH